ncbi:hypothetical protein INR49_015441 [Caranx melampygus]|nr:hypothetical protein INR49_015441 [Caranx melampygus]
MATGTIHQLEMPEYMNEVPGCGEKCNRNKKQTERRLAWLLFLGFGVLCIIQAILNVSLRLALYTNEESPPSNCNTTQFTDQKKEVESYCHQRRPGCNCNRLQEKFNALTREKDLLQNRVSELNNRISMVEKERDRLKMRLIEPSATLTCPLGWRKINSRCYFLSCELKTWEQSRQYCQSKGADLVMIDSEQEQAALYRPDGEGSLKVWIGLRRTHEFFQWMDGSELTTVFWQDRRPNGNSFPQIDCVYMNHLSPVTANWEDAPCREMHQFFCERDPAPDQNINLRT